jgi:hypothetical protein
LFQSLRVTSVRVLLRIFWNKFQNVLKKLRALWKSIVFILNWRRISTGFYDLLLAWFFGLIRRVNNFNNKNFFTKICSSEIEVEIYFKNGENGKACRKFAMGWKISSL